MKGWFPRNRCIRWPISRPVSRLHSCRVPLSRDVCSLLLSNKDQERRARKKSGARGGGGERGNVLERKSRIRNNEGESKARGLTRGEASEKALWLYSTSLFSFPSSSFRPSRLAFRNRRSLPLSLSPLFSFSPLLLLLLLPSALFVSPQRVCSSPVLRCAPLSPWAFFVRGRRRAHRGAGGRGGIKEPLLRASRL